MLCIKIISKLPIPEIPSLGVSSFMICFNNLILSYLYLKLNQFNIYEYIKFENFGNFVIKIIINYIKILLILKIFQYIKLLSFIIIINLKTLILSYIVIRKKNKPYNYKDLCYYYIFFVICISEIVVQNKLSIIFIFILIN